MRSRTRTTWATARPYAFVTRDYGAHWTKIVDGLPADQWARAIRPDIRDRNIVYLGTEEGIWISFDGGANWQSFQNDLPTVSVHDIRMQPHDDDLVIATHGRSAYIMDDVRPVQELQQAVARGTVALSAARRPTSGRCTQTTKERTRTTPPTTRRTA